MSIAVPKGLVSSQITRVQSLPVRVAAGLSDSVVAGQTGNVICEACREQRHDECRGGSWCNCQHRPPKPVEPATGPAGEHH